MKVYIVRSDKQIYGVYEARADAEAEADTHNSVDHDYGIFYYVEAHPVVVSLEETQPRYIGEV